MSENRVILINAFRLECVLFIKFHQLSSGKLTCVPFHVIKYIVINDDGGSTIFTNLVSPQSGKLKNFRSKESPNEIYKSSVSIQQSHDGIFSLL